MSRIGKQHISIPSGVTVTTDTDQVAVSGPKGELKQPLLDGIKVETTNEGVQIQRSSEEPQVKGAHGLMRSLVANMVTGVSQGFEKKLEVNGVGYRVALQVMNSS